MYTNMIHIMVGYRFQDLYYATPAKTYNIITCSCLISGAGRSFNALCLVLVLPFGCIILSLPW